MNKFITNKISNLAKFDEYFADLIPEFLSKTNKEIYNHMANSELLERVITLANSSYFKTQTTLKNIDDVMDYYGKWELFAFIIYAYFEKILVLQLPSYHISKQDFEEISLTRNAIMFEWIRDNHDEKYQFLPAATIALEFGRVLIDDMLMNLNKSEEFYEEIKDCVFPSDFFDVERKFCGCDRESVNVALFSHFGLSDISILIKFSNLIDDADFEIKDQCAMLKVVKTAISIYHRLDEISIENTLNLLDELMFEQDAFLKAAKKVVL